MILLFPTNQQIIGYVIISHFARFDEGFIYTDYVHNTYILLYNSNHFLFRAFLCRIQ
jgi:hypothetical protein